MKGQRRRRAGAWGSLPTASSNLSPRRALSKCFVARGWRALRERDDRTELSAGAELRWLESALDDDVRELVLHEHTPELLVHFAPHGVRFGAGPQLKAHPEPGAFDLHDLVKFDAGREL